MAVAGWSGASLSLLFAVAIWGLVRLFAPTIYFRQRSSDGRFDAVGVGRSACERRLRCIHRAARTPNLVRVSEDFLGYGHQRPMDDPRANCPWSTRAQNLPGWRHHRRQQPASISQLTLASPKLPTRQLAPPVKPRFACISSFGFTIRPWLGCQAKARASSRTPKMVTRSCYL